MHVCARVDYVLTLACREGKRRRKGIEREARMRGNWTPSPPVASAIATSPPRNYPSPVAEVWSIDRSCPTLLCHPFHPLTLIPPLSLLWVLVVVIISVFLSLFRLLVCFVFFPPLSSPRREMHTPALHARCINREGLVYQCWLGWWLELELRLY